MATYITNNEIKLINESALQAVINKMQVEVATVIRTHMNAKYDITIMGGKEAMVNVRPLDPRMIFSVDDSVLVQIPFGNRQLARIVARSNIKIPVEEILKYLWKKYMSLENLLKYLLFIYATQM